MAKPKVVIADQIAQKGIDVLGDACTVVDCVGAERTDLEAELAEADALIVRSATTVDAAMIAAAPRLKVIGRAGVGLDNIDQIAASAAGVTVVNAPNASTVSAAEHTLALVLALARRVPEADASLRAGEWKRAKLKGAELNGKTLGIIGLGRIGTHVATLAKAFGMEVIASDPYVTDIEASERGARLVEFEELLAESDVVSIHMPRTSETEGMIDAAALGSMKEGVRIVNVARGGIVDEQALADGIESGHVAGAALDVFANEPLDDSPLLRFSQVVVTPHLGASTFEAQERAATDTADAVLAALTAASDDAADA